MTGCPARSGTVPFRRRGRRLSGWDDRADGVAGKTCVGQGNESRGTGDATGRLIRRWGSRSTIDDEFYRRAIRWDSDDVEWGCRRRCCRICRRDQLAIVDDDGRSFADHGGNLN